MSPYQSRSRVAALSPVPGRGINWRIAHNPPVLVDPVVYPDQQQSRHQLRHHGSAVLDRGAIHAAPERSRAVYQLTSQEVDPVDHLLQDEPPVLLCVPAFCLVSPSSTGLAGVLKTRVVPEVAVQVGVSQDRQNQTPVLLKQRHDVLGGVKVQHASQEHLPALPIREWLVSLKVPLPVQGVERRPLEDQDMIDLILWIKMLGLFQPATRSMEPNRCGVAAAGTIEAFLVRQPAFPQLGNSHRPGSHRRRHGWYSQFVQTSLVSLPTDPSCNCLLR